MILTLTGASGAGKSTLAKALIHLLPNAKLSPGCTTREMRRCETADDVHHLSQEEFSEMHRRGEFLWTVDVHGVRYGTLQRVISDALMSKEQCLLFALTSDVLPILNVFAKKNDCLQEIRSIYVLSPDEQVLRGRLAARGSDTQTIERRLNDCKAWDANARLSGLYDVMAPGQGDADKNARRVIDKLATFLKVVN